MSIPSSSPTLTPGKRVKTPRIPRYNDVHEGCNLNMWVLRERPDPAPVPFRFETTRPKQMVQHAREGNPSELDEGIEFHRSNADSALGIRIKAADDTNGVDTVRCYHFACITGLLPICNDVVTLKQNEIAFRGFVGLTKDDSRRMTNTERQHQICLIVNGTAYQSPPFIYCAGNTKGYQFSPSPLFPKWKVVDIVGRNNTYLPSSGEKIVCPQCSWETYPTTSSSTTRGAFLLGGHSPIDHMNLQENGEGQEMDGSQVLDTQSNVESENNDESRSAVEHLVGMKPILRHNLAFNSFSASEPTRFGLDFAATWDNKGNLTVSGHNLPVFRDDNGDYFPTPSGTHVVISNPSGPLWAQINLPPASSVAYKKRPLKKQKMEEGVETEEVLEDSGQAVRLEEVPQQEVSQEVQQEGQQEVQQELHQEIQQQEVQQPVDTQPEVAQQEN